MSIHSEHPFLPPEDERNQVRRFRGRMTLPVCVWTAAEDDRQAGWTVSSMMIADGPTPEVLGLLDEDSDLADLMSTTGAVAVSLLGWQHRRLADAFAAVGPAPGGPFQLGSWTRTEWGPVLSDAPGWLGARISSEPTHAGWSLLVRAVVEQVEVGPDPADGFLAYLRGRYRALNGA